MKKYQSKYSPNKEVTELQYVTEIICERCAENMGVVLPLRFWKNEEWAQYYKMQIRYASRLIKEYSSPIVLQTLRKNPHIYSLAPKWVEKKISYEYDRALAKASQPRTIQPIVTQPKVGRSQTKQNLRSKLD